MRLKVFARKKLRNGAQFVARATLFSNARRIKGLGFDALGAEQSLVVCGSPSRETFVVSAKDEIIGRELFVTGEFDFDKFVAALGVLATHRRGERPRVLLDVGANIGTICIPAVARGYVERAIAVEPDPDNCRLLRANLELNRLRSKVRVHETAAGAADVGTLELELSDYNMGDHRIRAPGAPDASGAGRQSVTVQSTTLDTICSDELDEKLLIWMDVQGFEGFVLAGSSELLARRVPLVLEFWPGALERTGSFPLIEKALANYGCFLDLKVPGRVRPISELRMLYDEIGVSDATTDILVI